VAAVGGLGLNLVLFLTNSWHAYPYFLGSDIVFVFAWLPFALTGAGGQPSVDTALERLRRSPRLRLAPLAPGQDALSRREVLVRAVSLAGVATLGIGGAAALAKGPYKGKKSLASLGGGARSAGPAAAPAPAAPAHHHVAHHPARPAVPQGAIKLGPSSRLPRGQGATYTDPGDGQPDIVVRDGSGDIRAFSAVCTHAGCTVGFEGGQIVCPCHGGTFDARSGAVISGPPPSGLTPRRVVESGGDIYAVPS
jgi:thiosulfate dehydrogenase [quinone] large subunit